MTSLDLYGPLPRSFNGNNYVIVLVDQFSKYTKMYPIKDQKLKTLQQVVENWYVPDIGQVPKEILTDCGGQFITRKWREFADRIGFGIKRTSPYNSQSNPVERVMREIGRAVRAYACDDHRRWDEILPRLELIINATTHASANFTPAELEDLMIDLVIGPPEALKLLARKIRDPEQVRLTASQEKTSIKWREKENTTRINAAQHTGTKRETKFGSSPIAVAI